MATKSVLRSSTILRSLLRQRPLSRPFLRGFSSSTFIASSPSTPLSHLISPAAAAAAVLFSQRGPYVSRNFSSDSDAYMPDNIVLVKSEEDLNNAFRKAEDESSQVIFYFTAEWCGPCRFLWPSLKGMSKDLSHVTVYKIDIDQEIGPSLSKLNIQAVPTLHFFAKGKRADEIVGADIEKMKRITYRLYG
ncbi:Thioredoxin O1, mitochondrial-like protein [Drosera capensis]